MNAVSHDAATNYQDDLQPANSVVQVRAFDVSEHAEVADLSA